MQRTFLFVKTIAEEITEVQSTDLFVKTKVEVKTEVQRTDLYKGDKQKKQQYKALII